jgi:hypothetical protein
MDDQNLAFGRIFNAGGLDFLRGVGTMCGYFSVFFIPKGIRTTQ